MFQRFPVFSCRILRDRVAGIIDLGIGLPVAFILFTVTFIPFGFMSAYFFGVIQHNHSSSGRPRFKMLQQANSFIKEIRDNVFGHELLENYSWLNHFEKSINSNCNDMPENLQYLKYTGYLMAMYNTILMHILLGGILPITMIACLGRGLRTPHTAVYDCIRSFYDRIRPYFGVLHDPVLRSYFSVTVHAHLRYDKIRP